MQQFLTDLALTHHVAASTQNQALSALVFLYKAVLHQDIGWIEDVIRAKKPKRLPVVLTRAEVKAVLRHVSGHTWLMTSLRYGAGRRLMECLRLRVKDVDFAYHCITVRNEKGAQDCITMLSDSVHGGLQQHLHDVHLLHARDLEEGYGSVYLPYALERKYPNASRDWLWQYVFPAATRSVDPRSGRARRHHIAPLVLQRAVKAARKENHPTLHGETKRLFEDSTADQLGHVTSACHTPIDAEHGRLETRPYWITSDIECLGMKASWANIHRVGMVEARREVGDGAQNMACCAISR